MIYEGMEPSIEKIQWSELNVAPTKIEDMPVEMRDPLEEITLGTDEELRVSYISSLLPDNLT